MERRGPPPSIELTKVDRPYPKREKPTNPEQYAARIFKSNRITPKPDPELVGLVAGSSQYFEDVDLSRFLKSEKRFDGPALMLEPGEDDLERAKTVEHHDLRKCLKELPRYMQAAEAAGLTYEQAVQILIFTLDSNSFKHPSVNLDIALLTHALNAAEQYGIELGMHLDAFKDLIKSASTEDVTSRSYFYAFSIALRLGLSVGQACRIIKKLSDVRMPSVGYVMPHFIGALKSMLPAKVNPELVVEVFGLLADNNGNYPDLCNYFKNIMTFGGPSRGMTPEELLALFLTNLKHGGKKLPQLEDGGKKESAKEPMSVAKEKYFIESESEVLEHAALPYRKVRSLNEGIRDLERLAVARSAFGEEVGEGMWAFDPASRIWYSFGGQLETSSVEDVLEGQNNNSVRQRFLPYDLSKLSDKPFLFHVHPEEYQSFVSPRREGMAYPKLRDDITKFFTATPSGADYGVVSELLKDSEKKVFTRSFISHALGITEFIYPNDPIKLQKMKGESQGIRDQVLLEFNVEDYLTKKGIAIDDVDTFHLVQELIKALNKKLPRGFALKLHPSGTDFAA